MLRKGRSGFETRIINNTLSAFGEGVVDYESETLDYTTVAVYHPDFIIYDKARVPKIYIEAKGFFSPADRKKMLAVKRSHPTLDIRMLFQRPNNKLSKASKTKYWQWAEQHGFIWASGEHIPKKWVDEVYKT